MQLEWLGKYRPFIEMLFRFGNAYALISGLEPQAEGKISFSAEQIQTIEYILENESNNYNMAEYAYRLGTTPSAFSKNIGKLVEKGLVEKYHISGNRKNVIIRVSPLGRQIYEQYTEAAYTMFISKLYLILEEIPDEYVEKFSKVLETAASAIKENSEPQLIKIEE